MYESDKFNKEQQLSQLMDGEWYQLDRAECVASLCADEALQAKWARYHMIRDVLKNEPVKADEALSMRICDAIRNEPAYSNITPFNASVSGGADDASSARASELSSTTGNAATAVRKEKEKSSMFNTGVAGFAMAASVALVTVVGLNLFDQQSAPAVSGVASTDQIQTQTQTQIANQATNDSAVLPVVDLVGNTGPFWMSPASSQRAPDEKRLNKLLSQHIENSPTSVREGLFPYSRLVGYETVQGP